MTPAVATCACRTPSASAAGPRLLPPRRLQPHLRHGQHRLFLGDGVEVLGVSLPDGTVHASFCAAVCPETLGGASCSGVGCCRTSISPFVGALPSYGIQVKHLVGQTDYVRPPISVFTVDQEWFSRNEENMVRSYYYYPENLGTVVPSVPAVLEWSLGLIVDESLFTLSPIRPGRCNYIDECQQPDIYPCHGTCINLPGTYRCSSKKSIKNLPVNLIKQ
ncbi:hypothetical protein ACP70R_006681 [Stipagrostis hirtigluma subsp. patula]